MKDLLGGVSGGEVTAEKLPQKFARRELICGQIRVTTLELFGPRRSRANIFPF
jgi:hypothetical protein